jgi:small-conductance mechanosensitive channel
VPPELALAFSVPLRVAIVVSALVFASPIVTGDRMGSLTLLGGLLLVIVSLASVPLLANAVIGLVILWRRRVRVGERAELGGCRGRVLGMDLWSVRMEDGSGAELHVPHWLVLTHPMRVFPLMRRVTVALEVADTTPVAQTLTCLQHAPGDGFDHVTVMVVAVGEGRVSYDLSARSSMPHSESVLLSRVRVAAEADGIVIFRGAAVDTRP